MKIIIFGTTGMLGHKLIQNLSQRHDVTGTTRKDLSEYANYPVFSGVKILNNIDAADFTSINNAIEKVNPDVIINCIGIVKQLPQAQDPLPSITINSLFPHQLAQVCNKKGIRLIHYSTDCVFSGKDGNYKETDIPDPEDLYGRSKLLGEVTQGRCLTLRTSLIGRELSGFRSLFEWVLQQDGKEIHGYTKAIFSGLTTNAHAQILDDILTRKKNLTGLYHVASTPISKFDLISMIINRFNLNITIIADDSVVCNRSLDGSRFIKDTGISIPSWEMMIEQLYIDKTPYNNHRYVHK
ncbi:MAG: SDR family oxidoreductase [Methanospirillaceae archaeon]|nr:SDR family oxidoreductase [Methanospirillaceae archaeon]